MTSASQDLVEAYARLKALNDNLPNRPSHDAMMDALAALHVRLRKEAG